MLMLVFLVSILNNCRKYCSGRDGAWTSCKKSQHVGFASNPVGSYRPRSR